MEIKWSIQLKKNIDEVFFLENHNLLAVVHQDLKTLSLFSITSQEVLWTHIFSNSVIKNVSCQGKWLLIKYGGGKSGWKRIQVDSGDATDLKALEYLNSIVYVTSKYVVFKQDGGKSYAIFEISSGEITQVNDDTVMPYVISNCSSERYLAWQEVEGEYEMMLGDIAQDTAIPLKEGAKVFDHEGEGGELRKFASNSTHFAFVLNSKDKKYGWYTWQGANVSIFRAPESVTDEYSFTNNILLEKNKINYLIMMFSFRKNHKVILCNYNLTNGNLLWQIEVNSARNGTGFVIAGDYLIHAIGNQGYKLDCMKGDGHHKDESLQIDLMSGEVKAMIEEPIGHWLCGTKHGLYFCPLSQKRSCLAYAEFA